MIFGVCGALLGLSVIGLSIIAMNREEFRHLIASVDMFKGRFIAYPGLLVIELIGYDFSLDYDRDMLQIYSKLNSTDEAFHIYHISLALKISLALVSLVGLLFLLMLGIIQIPEHWIIYIAVCGALIMSNDFDARKRVDKREKDILSGFPGFINQLTLLLSAGLNVSAAWVFLAGRMKGETDFEKEVIRSADELSSGASEHLVYEGFAERCSMAPVRKSITVINQNIKKGTGDLIHSIQLISVELWAERKAMALREAEKSSSKILLPMGIILIGLLMVVITPLALQFLILM